MAADGDRAVTPILKVPHEKRMVGQLAFAKLAPLGEYVLYCQAGHWRIASLQPIGETARKMRKPTLRDTRNEGINGVDLKPGINCFSR
ncbi:hypothetical protein LJ656_31785 [Paraburkholderia sp. MMS20-SJTR3]|uniref:Uncharacterized protein n=1 Tax=Paraburkholderia sejongensis TaxID=2886946 RepID=A0ABS8K4S6_9BURK|nr:hypothetical protein [Paraburkholderia sp. MMS20-SJTR3]MCC8397159.1 hypothetical protein [Paraburkholderia sp. MMS20-SJTR3]